MKTLTYHQAEILYSHGFELSATAGLVFANVERASRAGLHDTFAPIAAVGWTLLAPAIAMLRLPDYELGQLVAERPAMGCDTAEVFALVSGLALTGPFANHPQPFYQHLCAVIDTHGLEAFFGQYPSAGELHHGIRPRGVGWLNGCDILPAEMKIFRANYRRLSAARQMLVATILWLYQGQNDVLWLKGLPRSWNAAHGILELQDSGVFEDWAKLVTLYPGW